LQTQLQKTIKEKLGLEMKIKLLKKKTNGEECKKCAEKQILTNERNYKLQELELQVQNKMHAEIEMKM
jgi:hypothetical protein